MRGFGVRLGFSLRLGLGELGGDVLGLETRVHIRIWVCFKAK